MAGILAAALQTAATTTMSGARRAFCRSRCSASALAAGCLRCSCFGHELPQALARGAADHDEAPRAQPPVIGRARGAFEQQLESALIGRGVGERLGGAPLEERVDGLHGRDGPFLERPRGRRGHCPRFPALRLAVTGYRPHAESFRYLFNSHYNTAAALPRSARHVVQPTVAEVLAYRAAGWTPQRSWSDPRRGFSVQCLETG